MGSPNKNLPGYVVMISKGRGQSQALYDRLWGSGFLPSKHQGVKFRSAGDPVLYLSNPKGVSRDMRRSMLDGIAKINQAKKKESGDPEIDARIAQYEMAYRMQTSVPELVDLKDEPKHVLDLYGKDAMRKGSFAHNCLIARRLSERGVPFVQLFHRGWDQHGSLPSKIRQQCEDVDQPAAALVRDLKQRGLLKDTIVICGGEFGRTIYSQGKLTKDNHGRDHHGRCFSMWLAGGGIKAGFEYGKTDDFAYNIVENPSASTSGSPGSSIPRSSPNFSPEPLPSKRHEETSPQPAFPSRIRDLHRHRPYPCGRRVPSRQEEQERQGEEEARFRDPRAVPAQDPFRGAAQGALLPLRTSPALQDQQQLADREARAAQFLHQGPAGPGQGDLPRPPQ